MNLWGKLLKWTGWKVDISAPWKDKCVICVAPHTSNWDFILGLLAYRSLGRRANFLMKKFWFFFPLKYLLKALGGIPVYRSDKGSGLTDQIIHDFKSNSYLNLAITPEGTRKATDKWRTGFLRIAIEADVPVMLGVIDYSSKTIIIREEFKPSSDINEDMAFITKYYSGFIDAAKYPEKFTLNKS